MAQWLRALTALLEVLSSIPSNYLGTHNHLYLGSDALFWLAGVHADRATHTFNFFFFFFYRTSSPWPQYLSTAETGPSLCRLHDDLS